MLIGHRSEIDHPFYTSSLKDMTFELQIYTSN